MVLRKQAAWVCGMKCRMVGACSLPGRRLTNVDRFPDPATVCCVYPSHVVLQNKLTVETRLGSAWERDSTLQLAKASSAPLEKRDYRLGEGIQNLPITNAHDLLCTRYSIGSNSRACARP